ncbi:hypothetical protein CRG98_042665 [Punica granatum]|uniref:CCHC-type domain-containing protein n=1 Tax=Punica granatum TaxID=22663 RepID=A0A2I0HZ20_PUNGR|nr:hypothetical protein CRG98_042665 [Punica granatum]
MDTRLGVVLERRLDVVVDRLAERMGALMEARQAVDLSCGRVPNPTADLEDDDDDSYSEGNETEYDRGNRRRDHVPTLAELEAGSRSVDKYTGKFYQLIARNELQETEDQLVARYIGELRVQLQDTINLFDPVSVSSAHQRALIIERQLKRAGSGVTNGGVAVAGTGRVIRAGSGSTILVHPSKPANIGPSSSGTKCFKCEEPRHKQSECRKGEKGAMFIEEDQSDEAAFVARGDGDPEFDEEEEIVIGDGVPNLMVRRSCMTPRAADEDWLRNNIFQITCTIENKVCRFMIDSGSCENIVSAKAVQKLGLHTEQHPKSYKLAWLKK